jgi:hypothetical protein
MIAAAITVAPTARADGIDVAAFVAGGLVPGRGIALVGMIALAMVLNYVINFVIVGIPAIKLGGMDARSVARGLVILTLLGQLADRIGLLAGVLIAIPLENTLGIKGEGSFVIPLIASSALCAGIAVGALVYHFVRRRWHVPSRPSWMIAVGAAILTNPVWMLIAWQ